MTIRTTRWPAGVPCWADLTAPDTAAAKAFYSDVIGWDFQDTEADYGGYAIATVGEAAAAGVGPAQAGAPAAWTLYFASDDADKAAAAGHRERRHCHRAPRRRRPPGPDVHRRRPHRRRLRRVAGRDPHRRRDRQRTRRPGVGGPAVPRPRRRTRFYEAVFGFTFQALEGAGDDYATFHLPGDEAPLGGMGGMMGAPGAPPHWVVYFAVDDADAPWPPPRAGAAPSRPRPSTPPTVAWPG